MVRQEHTEYMYHAQNASADALSISLSRTQSHAKSPQPGYSNSPLSRVLIQAHPLSPRNSPLWLPPPILLQAPQSSQSRGPKTLLGHGILPRITPAGATTTAIRGWRLRSARLQAELTP